MDEMLKPSNLISLPNELVGLSRYITTTMESSRILALAKAAATMSRQDVQFATLPGTDAYMADVSGQNLSFYLMDPTETRKLVDRSIRDINPAVAAGVRVQVTGSDQAKTLAERLVSQGFQAAVVTGKETAGERTRIVDLKGDTAKAQLVAKSLASLGFAVEIVSEPDLTAAADVRVILGRNGTE
jgi:anionic cell wall polymer biosynthesis LytR-Cps2A-Psr (LCP) family protein